MQYKPKKIRENKEEFFIYQPRHEKTKVRKIAKKTDKNNPFEKLSELTFR